MQHSFPRIFRFKCLFQILILANPKRIRKDSKEFERIADVTLNRWFIGCSRIVDVGLQISQPSKVAISLSRSPIYYTRVGTYPDPRPKLQKRSLGPHPSKYRKIVIEMDTAATSSHELTRLQPYQYEERTIFDEDAREPSIDLGRHPDQVRGKRIGSGTSSRTPPVTSDVNSRSIRSATAAKRWPSSPRTLGQKGRWNDWSTAKGTLLALLPVIFLGTQPDHVSK